MRAINYPCGCCLRDGGITVCPLHFVIFEDVLPLDYYVCDGWHNVSQDVYNRIVHCLNSDATDMKLLVEE